MQAYDTTYRISYTVHNTSVDARNIESAKNKKGEQKMLKEDIQEAINIIRDLNVMPDGTVSASGDWPNMVEDIEWALHRAVDALELMKTFN